MEQYVIKGGIPLVGDVEIGGAKNAALAILAAASMTDETVYIDNLPDVRDINALLEALDGIGAHVKRVNRHAVEINGPGACGIHLLLDGRQARARPRFCPGLPGQQRSRYS